MNRKFDQIYRQYVTEKEEPILAPPLKQGQAAQAAEEPPAPAENQDVSNQEPPAEQRTGTSVDSSSFVTMTRLLKDAFIIKPSDEDASKIIDIGEINGNNASEKFKVILGLIKKYLPELDIDLKGI